MSDALKQLATLMEGANVRMTFSRNCCSGIVGFLGADRKCECWRCRKERGQESDDDTEREAIKITTAAKKAFNRSLGIKEIRNQNEPST